MKKSFLFLVASLFYITIYAQWSTNPAVNTAISTAAYQQNSQQMVRDGAGGAILTWMDYNSAINERSIYAQRIDASGIIIWTAGGVPICTVLGNQQNPQITSDGNGGAIIAWQDNRDFYHPTIYAQRIDASGLVQWTADGIAISDGVGESFTQLISDGSGGAIVTWKTSANGYSRIKTQRINAAGMLQWVTGGVEVSPSKGVELPQIISDGSDGAIISWNEWDTYPIGSHDIYAQRINADGAIQWGTRGTAICTATDNQLGAKLTTDGNHGAIISWRDQRNGAGATGAVMYAQKINSSGIVQWVLDGVPVATAVSAPRFQKLVTDGSGGAFITWNDNSYVIAQHLASDGTSKWGAAGKSLGFGQSDEPQIISDYSTGSIVTWSDGSDIIAQRLDINGNFLWNPAGLRVCTAVNVQGSPQILPDGNGHFILTWVDKRNNSTTESDIYGQLVNNSGLLILSIQDKLNTRLNIYPNPVHNELNISRRAAATGEFIIYEMSGKEVFRRKISGTYSSINTEFLLPGFYVTCYKEGQTSTIAKLIKY